MSNEILWNFKTTCEKLQISEHGLRWRIRKRQIPFIKIGEGRGKIYFSPVDLESWIMSRKINMVKE